MHGLSKEFTLYFDNPQLNVLYFDNSYCRCLDISLLTVFSGLTFLVIIICHLPDSGFSRHKIEYFSSDFYCLYDHGVRNPQA